MCRDASCAPPRRVSMTITQNAIIMVFGALIAIAGLVLLYLRSERGENKIKLFGQEFQVSAPALVVFLAGCAVFVTPLVHHWKLNGSAERIVPKTHGPFLGWPSNSGNASAGRC